MKHYVCLFTFLAAAYGQRYMATLRSEWGYVVPGAHSAERSFGAAPKTWIIDPKEGTICEMEEGPLRRCLAVVEGQLYGASLTLTTVPPGGIPDTMRFDVIPTGVVRPGGHEEFAIMSRAVSGLVLDADESAEGSMMMWPWRGSAQQKFTMPATRDVAFQNRIWDEID